MHCFRTLEQGSSAWAYGCAAPATEPRRAKSLGLSRVPCLRGTRGQLSERLDALLARLRPEGVANLQHARHEAVNQPAGHRQSRKS